jgi:hypothetical protein
MAPPPRLPPDLARVGDELVEAAARRVAKRDARRRLAGRIAATGVAALIAVAALAPAALGPAEQATTATTVLIARAPTVDPPGLPAACDQPRGGRLSLPACASGDAIRVGRARRW